MTFGRNERVECEINKTVNFDVEDVTMRKRCHPSDERKIDTHYMILYIVRIILFRGKNKI